jgi:predicted regulator of Ras-like GTPase activity (Roadblock/LC7/MglB family)
MEATNVLAGLRDIEGIIGSFVVSSEGGLLGRDLPTVFDDDTLLGVAPRLVRLRDGIASDSAEPTGLVLRYGEHKLHIRAAGSGLLCVLSESKVNTPALRVGMKLVARRVASLGTQPPAVQAASSVPPPVTQRSQIPQPPSTAAAPSTAPAPRSAAPTPSAAPASSKAPSGMIYRGQRVG